MAIQRNSTLFYCNGKLTTLANIHDIGLDTTIKASIAILIKIVFNTKNTLSSFHHLHKHSLQMTLKIYNYVHVHIHIEINMKSDLLVDRIKSLSSQAMEP